MNIFYDPNYLQERDGQPLIKPIFEDEDLNAQQVTLPYPQYLPHGLILESYLFDRSTVKLWHCISQ